MKTLKYMVGLSLILFELASCSKEQVDVNNDGNNDLNLEGQLENSSWVLEPEDFPNQGMKDNLDKMEFHIDENLNITWFYDAKPGKTDYEMKGDIYFEKSQFNYDNGSGIYNVRVNISHINGQNLSGGYYGIFTWEDEDHWVLNIEPDVQGWSDHPTADEGIGSGANGEGSVYRFKALN